MLRDYPPSLQPPQATFFHDGDPGCSPQNWNGCDKGTTNCNSSHPSSFAPTNLNVSSWVASLLEIGATHAVLTAKHGCGFLLWPTQQTLPSGAPYTYHVPPEMNVLKLFSDAMTAAGLGHGCVRQWQRDRAVAVSFAQPLHASLSFPPNSFYYSLTNNFYL